MRLRFMVDMIIVVVHIMANDNGVLLAQAFFLELISIQCKSREEGREKKEE